MELTAEALQAQIKDATGTAIKDAMGDITAAIKAATETTPDGNVPDDKLKALEQQIGDRLTAVEAENTELKKQIVERQFTPVLDAGLGRQIKMPMTERTLRRRARDEAELAGHKLNDELYLIKTILQLDARGLRETQMFKDAVEFYGKAIDALTTGQGLEWTPVGYSSQVIDATYLQNQVASLFPTLTMPTASYKVPIQLARPKAYKTTRATNITEFTDTITDDVTFDAVGLGTYIQVAKEATEDMLVPILPWLQTNMALGLGEGIERCIINGDVTGTHMDTDIEAAGPTAAETCWDGLRHRALAVAGCKVDLATWNADVLLSMKTAMGKYGLFPRTLAWIFNTGLLNQLLLLKDAAGNPLVQTIDRYGANATILTGEIGRLFGIPVVPSEWCREDTTAAGINGVSGNTRKTCLLVNREAFFVGDRRSVTLETQADIVPQTIKVVATCRNDFKHVFVDAATDVAVGYNAA